jgi:alcohol dehydrogenase, propanol-preferring
MLAYQLVAPGRREVRRVPILTTGPGQVLVRVAYAGLCGTDLEFTRNSAHFGTDAAMLPLTMGHEFSGWVEQVGDGVSWGEGELVVPYGMRGCGACRSCRAGEENLCLPRPTVLGIGRDGGLADFVLLDAADLVEADGVPPDQAAGMTDAGMTAYAAAERVAGCLRDDRIVVAIGVGGVGHLAVQFLHRRHGAQVGAIDIDPRKLDFARKLGAWRTAEFDDARAQLAALVADQCVDAVIDMVGTSPSLALARDLVRPGGIVRVVGTANGEMPFSFFGVPRGTAFVRSSGGTRDELRAALDAARKGQVMMQAVDRPFDQIDDAFAALESGAPLGRLLIRMGR